MSEGNYAFNTAIEFLVGGQTSDSLCGIIPHWAVPGLVVQAHKTPRGEFYIYAFEAASPPADLAPHDIWVLGPAVSQRIKNYVREVGVDAPAPAVRPDWPWQNINPTELRSQKARGVRYLSGLFSLSLAVPKVTYWQDDKRQYIDPRRFPLFARPCPTEPRHGFVDSRPVFSADEAHAVYAEALAADPGAELMLMPVIQAKCSMVVTPQWAAVGPGHDGATAGKAGAVAVQLLHTHIDAGDGLVPEGQIPYIEAVHGNTGEGYSKTYAVQLRSGPAIGGQGAGNYVPAEQTVETVIDANRHDALELEAMIADAVGNGLRPVIWQAQGNPCSHAACHARLNDLAIVFDDTAPALGTVLAKTSEAAQPMETEALSAALRAYGVDEGALPERMSAAYLWAVHQGPALACSEAGARFVALAAVRLWRYAACACIGEARHSHFCPNGRRRQRRQRSREVAWSTAVQQSAIHPYLRRRVAMALAAFETADNFESGYGGDQWAICARSSLALYDAIVEASTAPSEETARALILAAHAVVNCAHNSGPFLSKFIGESAFDRAAAGNLKEATDGLVALYDLEQSEVPAGVGRPWPKRRLGGTGRRVRAPRPVDPARVQFNLRMDGGMLHAQARIEGKAYRSATVPIATLAYEQIAHLALYIFCNEPTLTSAANSSTMYWPAEGVLSSDTLLALYPKGLK